MKPSEWARDPTSKSQRGEMLEGLHYFPLQRALTPSLSASTRHPEPDRSLHKKSENTRAPGTRQDGELGTCRPGNSSNEAVGLKLPAWETGE